MAYSFKLLGKEFSAPFFRDTIREFYDEDMALCLASLTLIFQVSQAKRKQRNGNKIPFEN